MITTYHQIQFYYFYNFDGISFLNMHFLFANMYFFIREHVFIYSRTCIFLFANMYFLFANMQIFIREHVFFCSRTCKFREVKLFILMLIYMAIYIVVLFILYLRLTDLFSAFPSSHCPLYHLLP